MKLGLTELQSKTYLALTRFEKAEVKKISETTKIARQDLYRIIPSLEKLGLVEKIIATPLLYRAIPLSEGTLSLFKKRSDEYVSLKSNLEQLIADHEGNSKSVVQEENESEFVITSERKRLVDKLEKTYYESSTLDLMIPGTGINFMIFNFYECLITALSKHAKIRVITKKTDIRPSATQKIRKLQTYPNFQIRFDDTTFEFGMAICNNREVNIAISNKEVPSLWTNNPQILKISQLMFENQWNAKVNQELICEKAGPVRVNQ